MESAGATPQVAVDGADLARLARSSGPFATVYLTTESGVENAAQRSEQHWKTVRAAMLDQAVPAAVVEAIDPLVRDAHLHGEGLAAVATEAGLQHMEHLPEAPAAGDLWRWAPLPSIVPLLEWRQRRPPYVALVADRQGADLVAVGRGGDVSVERQAGGDDDPLARSAPGGWSQLRYQHRAENTWDRNAQDVARQLTELVEQVDAHLVVVAGDVRAVQLLGDALPERVRELVHEVGGEPPVGGVEAIDPDIDRVVNEVVARETDVLLEKLREELGQADRGAHGVTATVEALRMAKVEVLLVHDNADDERVAWFGPEPAHLALSAAELESLGVDDPQPGRLVDAAVRAALGTGARVRVVPDGAWPTDGLGAILRWSA